MLVKQAANVLDLIEYFAARKQPATLADIAQHFDWPRSSTFNLLGTLAERGFLYEPQSRGNFYPTPRWWSLSQDIAQAEPIPAVARALLQDVWKATGETSVIAAPVGTNAVFLETIESPHAVRYTAQPGKIVPLHTTAVGQALLAQFSEKSRASTLRKVVFERHTETTLMSVDAVESEIQRGIQRGWFESTGGFTSDLGGIAMPLPYPERYLTVLVAGPMSRVQPRYAEIASQMQAAIATHFPGAPATRTAGTSTAEPDEQTEAANAAPVRRRRTPA
ncbi:IclR family transcriptional regulator [Cupriavidus alkaliphilus]|uniref:IclR family transcriptional regulator n=1 Tax=Cupriavidus alkaliphilus TaxID=942866 RepID=UPI00339D6B0D